MVTDCDLAHVSNRNKLIDMTKRLFSEFGLDSILDTDEWVKIRKRAKMDSRRMTTEEFKEELFGINYKIRVVGEYTKANDRIKVQCKTCNHTWNAIPASLRLGVGCPRKFRG